MKWIIKYLLIWGSSSLGALAWIAVTAAFQDLRLAAGPVRRRPAFGSGPVATVIQDVLSLLIYFAVVILLFGH